MILAIVKSRYRYGTMIAFSGFVRLQLLEGPIITRIAVFMSLPRDIYKVCECH